MAVIVHPIDKRADLSKRKHEPQETGCEEREDLVYIPREGRGREELSAATRNGRDKTWMALHAGFPDHGDLADTNMCLQFAETGRK